MRIAITKSIRQSLTIVIGLTVTENYYHQKEKSGEPLPPVGCFWTPPQEPREILQKNSAGSHAYEGGQNMAEETKSNEKKAKKRTNKLTNARIKKEIEFLTPMFAGIDDEDKKSLVNSLVEEAAFLKVACFQAKEELKKEGLTTETVNASQKFVKAHPSATIYEKYSRQYTAIIHTLIEYLPPKEKKNISRLAALRNG